MPDVSKYLIEKQIDELNMRDLTYDGVSLANGPDASAEQGILYGGLGQLVDGVRAANDQVLDGGDVLSHAMWVGWPQLTDAQSTVVKIVFQFESVQNFTLLQVNCLHSQQRGVSTFTSAQVWFSLDNLHWTVLPIHYDHRAKGMEPLVQGKPAFECAFRLNDW